MVVSLVISIHEGIQWLWGGLDIWRGREARVKKASRHHSNSFSHLEEIIMSNIQNLSQSSHTLNNENSHIRMLLIGKLHTPGLSKLPVYNCILDSLTNRLQTVWIGSRTSSKLVINTRGPPGLCALLPPVHTTQP